MAAQNRLPFTRPMKQQGSNRAVIPSNVEGSLRCGRDCKPSLHHTPENTRGFTLVELAIALMVIGLLIGGVLKGQELIENARHVQMVRQIKSYETAITLFRSTYNALPGDMRDPAKHLPDCTTDPCQISGTGDGYYNTSSERINFWVHQQQAGFISGVNYDATYHDHVSPVNPYGGYLTVGYYASMNPSDVTGRNYYIISDSYIPSRPRARASLLFAVDQKIDDGLPLTGIMQLSSDPAVVTMNTCHEDGQYLKNIRDCLGLILIEGAN